MPLGRLAGGAWLFTAGLAGLLARAQPLEGRFGPAPPQVPVQPTANGAGASPAAPPGKIACPPQHYRSSSIIWVCEAAAGRRFFYMKPQVAETALQIPVGVTDLRINASTSAVADMELLDPRTHAYIIRDGSQVPGRYGRMNIHYANRAVGMQNTQEVLISELTTPLLLNFRNRDPTWRTVTLTFSFQFQGICPGVPAGCSRYDEAAAWEEVKDWSSWAQSKYVNAGVAWRGLANDLTDQIGGRNLGVPWYRWGACWEKWGAESSSSSWQRTFALLDIDKNDYITIDEFATGFRLAGPPGGSGFSFPTWLIWLLPMLLLCGLGARFAMKEMNSAGGARAYMAMLKGEENNDKTFPINEKKLADPEWQPARREPAKPPDWKESIRGCNSSLEKMLPLDCGWRNKKELASAKEQRTLPPVLAWRAPNDSEDDEIAALIRSMQAEPNNASLQASSCQRLERLALGNQSKKNIAAMGGIDIILQAMQRHGLDPNVQEHGCGALGNLAQRSEQNQRDIGAKKGTELICRAMLEHSSSTSLQERACWVTEQLAMTAQNRGEIVNCSGIDRIVFAMHTHIASEAVQEHGCMALGNMAFDARTRKQIAFSGGIDAIIAAMTAFPASPPLQENACFAIHNMACSDEAMKPIAEANGIEAVVRAMKEHPEVEGVQENAINALHNVNCGPLQYIHRVIDAEGVKLILQAMEHHSSPSLQAKACHVLGQLGDRDEYVRQLIDRQGGVSAIEFVKVKYQQYKEVQQEAREALKILKES